MSDQMQMRAEVTHKVINAHFAEMGKRYAALQADAPSYTTISASGSAAYVYVYLRVDCTLTFSNVNLRFAGNGGVLGLGATGSLGGQASFNVDPATLKNASGITFEATGLSIGAGGFQVTWYQNHGYIGHGEFYGLGISLGTPGGGTGSFS